MLPTGPGNANANANATATGTKSAVAFDVFDDAVEDLLRNTAQDAWPRFVKWVRDNGGMRELMSRAMAKPDVEAAAAVVVGAATAPPAGANAA